MAEPDSSRLRGAEAAALRLKKSRALREFRLPAEGVAGSLALTHRRCGKTGCHCAQPGGEGHAQWLLTFMVDGEKHVEVIPAEWVAEVQRRVEAGRTARERLGEVLTTNAQLLALERRVSAKRRKKRT